MPPGPTTIASVPGKPPRAPQRGTTAAAAIYRDLRADIVSLARKPGDPILEKLVAEAFGVSRTPVREAVLRLADEGLVEIFPQSGTFVGRIPIAALPEANLIRKTLEQATVDASANAQGFHQADEAFHALIADIAGHPGFWPITQQVKVQIDRCRHLTLPFPGRMAAVIAEHEAIIAAIADHDPDRAVKALGDHIDGLLLTIDDMRLATPLYFSPAEAPT